MKNQVKLDIYNVYFENQEGKKRLIGEATGFAGALEIILDFMKEKEYTSYYKRYHELDNGDWIVDVGSHTERFIIRPHKINV